MTHNSLRSWLIVLYRWLQRLYIKSKRVEESKGVEESENLQLRVINKDVNN